MVLGGYRRCRDVYKHGQATKEFVDRKYLNECTPYRYVSMCVERSKDKHEILIGAYWHVVAGHTIDSHCEGRQTIDDN